ncbi:MAG TPA: trypsin-like peptidase domain-containing protein [Mycobacteriales bacterium]|nr:trypsin-like peptidase domain-containing protein [Mycobacteriales bacterium]
MRIARTVAAAIALAGMLAAGAAPATAGAPKRVTATPYAGTPTVGALFITGLFPLHICTASVVDSADRSVIMTTAHCIRSGTGAGYEFAPAFHDGKAPYGMWRVTAAYAAPGWIRHADPHDDFAFLLVAPKQVDGKRRTLQSVTGGNRLGSTPAAGSVATAFGYPLGVGGSGLRCRATTYRKGSFDAIRCNGFADGTSGGPWLSGTGSSRMVVGLVGGLHQGGCTKEQLYSPPIGEAAHRALARAGRRGPADRFPVPPSDGCTTGQ